MSKKSFNPEECIGPLNNAKRAMQMTGHPFTKESMLTSLKGCGLPTNSTFWSVFRNSGILQEVSKGEFMFTSKDPIYIGTLNTIKRKYIELMHRYSSNSKKPKVEVPEVIEEESKLSESNPQATVQSAIDFLKEQGYLVFAPIGTIYRKL